MKVASLFPILSYKMFIPAIEIVSVDGDENEFSQTGSLFTDRFDRLKLPSQTNRRSSAISITDSDQKSAFDISISKSPILPLRHSRSFESLVVRCDAQETIDKV